jgi:hypothetical protein
MLRDSGSPPGAVPADYPEVHLYWMVIGLLSGVLGISAESLIIHAIAIAMSSTTGTAVYLPPALFQPIASEMWPMRRSISRSPRA